MSPDLPNTPNPPRRPNRAHGAVDRLPEEIRQLIRDWYIGDIERKIPRLTYEQISAELGNLGHSISKDQVFRWLARQRNYIDRIAVSRERAQALVKHLVPDGTDVESAATTLATSVLFEALVDCDPMKANTIGELASIAHALGKLQTSSVAREKWEIEKRRKIEEAVKQLKAEVQQLLADNPSLTRELLDHIDRAQIQMLEKTA